MWFLIKFYMHVLIWELVTKVLIMFYVTKSPYFFPRWCVSINNYLAIFSWFQLRPQINYFLLGMWCVLVSGQFDSHEIFPPTSARVSILYLLNKTSNFTFIPDLICQSTGCQEWSAKKESICICTCPCFPIRPLCPKILVSVRK